MNGTPKNIKKSTSIQSGVVAAALQILRR